MTPVHAYRQDIDALRGVAVAAVVLFHAFPAAMSGGFLGVDVFFVISGYLITGIVARDLEAGTFSLSSFYSRRIRRIFPALLSVLVAAGVAGWWLLLSTEYESLAKHIASATIFVSNFTSGQEAGYFDEAAHTKPLLHLWSLAIEEQFYLVWPLLLWVATHRGRSPLRASLLAAASIAICGVILFSEPAGNFFNPLARAWELLLGGALASAERSPSWVTFTARRRGASPWLAAAGGSALVGSLFFGTSSMRHPGWITLAPVMGTAALIAANSMWLRRARLLIWVGLISYPLYLWHWPLLSFLRIVAGQTPSPVARGVAITVGIALAWATYSGFEWWFRASVGSAKKTAGLVVSMAVVGLVGTVIWSDEGIIERGRMAQFEIKLHQYNVSIWGRTSTPNCVSRALPLRYCLQTRDAAPEFAVVGDSHAEHLYPGLAMQDQEHSWLVLGHNATLPFLGVASGVANDGMTRQAKAMAAIDFVAASPSIHTVLLSFFAAPALEHTAFAADDLGRFQHTMLTSTQWPNASPDELVYLGLSATIERLQAAGKHVVVVKDVPELPFFPRDCLRRPLADYFKRHCVLLREAVVARQAKLTALLDRVVEHHRGVTIYDPANVLCSATNCSFESADSLLYRDSHHLSPDGSSLVAGDLAKWLREHGQANP